MNYSAAFRIVMVNEDASDVHVSSRLALDPLEEWCAQADPNDSVRYGVLVYEEPVDVETALTDARLAFRVALQLPGGVGPKLETMAAWVAIASWSGDFGRSRVAILRNGRTYAEAYVDPCEVARSRW